MSELFIDRPSPPSAPAIQEHLLTGGRALRRAFLETELHSVADGTPIPKTRESEPGLFLIRRGFAFRYHDMSDGRRAIVDILIPGDIAGLDHLLVGRPVAEFAAGGRASYQTLPAEAVRKMMECDPSIMWRVFALLAEGRWRIERMATTVMRLEARERLAALLLSLYQRLRRHGLINGLTFNLPLTQGQIADHLGLTLVHVNRMSRQLREERLVTVHRGVVIINDYEALCGLLRGVPEPAYVPSPMISDAKRVEPFGR